MELLAQAEMAVETASTDDAATHAFGLIQSARQQVSKVLDASRNFAPEAHKIATREFTALRDRCEEIEKTLLASGLNYEGTADAVGEAEQDYDGNEKAAEIHIDPNLS